MVEFRARQTNALIGDREGVVFTYETLPFEKVEEQGVLEGLWVSYRTVYCSRVICGRLTYRRRGGKRKKTSWWYHEFEVSPFMFLFTSVKKESSGKDSTTYVFCWELIY